MEPTGNPFAGLLRHAETLHAPPPSPAPKRARTRRRAHVVSQADVAALLGPYNELSSIAIAEALGIGQGVVCTMLRAMRFRGEVAMRRAVQGDRVKGLFRLIKEVAISTARSIRIWLSAHPGSTAPQIAAALDLHISVVTAQVARDKRMDVMLETRVFNAEIGRDIRYLRMAVKIEAPRVAGPVN